MVVYEDLENDLVKAYSDQKMMIRGGRPEGLYSEAIDPKSAGRTYVETDTPIPEDEPEEDLPDA
jgi:hypothetical protein